MAVLQDPTGAAFAVWQSIESIGAELVNEPGTLCWNELHSRDSATATQFYSRLFGWTSTTSPGLLGGEYTEFKNGDQPAAGTLEIQPEWGDVPSNWAVYFAVADCNASVADATSMGAMVVVPQMDIENIGRFAFLQDPQGAHFAVIKLIDSPA